MAATGDINIGGDTKSTGKELKMLTELFRPSMLCSYDIYYIKDLVNLAICDPVCVHGACVSNNTCSCSDGYEGKLCDRPGTTDLVKNV